MQFNKFISINAQFYVVQRHYCVTIKSRVTSTADRPDRDQIVIRARPFDPSYPLHFATLGGRMFQSWWQHAAGIWRSMTSASSLKRSKPIATDLIQPCTNIHSCKFQQQWCNSIAVYIQYLALQMQNDRFTMQPTFNTFYCRNTTNWENANKLVRPIRWSCDSYENCSMCNDCEKVSTLL